MDIMKQQSIMMDANKNGQSEWKKNALTVHPFYIEEKYLFSQSLAFLIPELEFEVVSDVIGDRSGEGCCIFINKKINR